MIRSDVSLSSSLRDETRRPVRSGFTLLELLVVIAIVAVLITLLLPAVRTSGEAARRTQCRNNLKQISLALHNYHDVYQSFPPAYTMDANGQPLHSWRTLILPFLEQQRLYDSIDLSKSWDDPANEEAYKQLIPQYHCPSSEVSPPSTTYMAVVGPEACIHPQEGRQLSEISDGTSHTVMLVEVSPEEAVHWMAPQDVGLKFFMNMNTDSDLSHTGGIHAAMADGSVQFISAKIDQAIRRALITIADGDTVGDW